MTKVTFRAERPEEPQEGDLYPIPDDQYENYRPEKTFTREYLDHTRKIRPPLVVMIKASDGHLVPFMLDSCASGKDEGWEVTMPWPLDDGQVQPPITVRPSIKIEAGPKVGYHGYITEGVIGPDLDADKR